MILVSSYPKSGATWFRFLMYACTNGEIEKSRDVRRFYPGIRIQQALIQKKIEEGERFFVKSHYPYTDKIPFFDNIKATIYIARNPLDVIASYINHVQVQDNPLTKKRQINNIIKAAIKNANKREFQIHTENAAGGWNNHVISWLEENKNIPVHIIKYEDLLSKPFETIKKLSEDMDLGFSDEAIKLGIDQASFNNMRKIEEHEIMNDINGMFLGKKKKRKKAFIEKNKRFVNKGKKGNYLDLMTEDQITSANNAFEKGMKLLHYL